MSTPGELSGSRPLHLLSVPQLLANLDPAILDQNGLEYETLRNQTTVLDLETIKPIEANGSVALLTVLELGGDIGLQICGAVEANGSIAPDFLMVAASDENIYRRTDRDHENPVHNEQRIFIMPFGVATDFGRKQRSAERLGLDDRHISRRHFGLMLPGDGTLKIQDYGSTNGTRVIRAKQPEQKTPLRHRTQQWLGRKATTRR